MSRPTLFCGRSVKTNMSLKAWKIENIIYIRKNGSNSVLWVYFYDQYVIISFMQRTCCIRFTQEVKQRELFMMMCSFLLQQLVSSGIKFMFFYFRFQIRLDRCRDKRSNMFFKFINVSLEGRAALWGSFFNLVGVLGKVFCCCFGVF